ncbi:MAG: DUF4279 domain-containing protein [Alphaproteobacteria bacterium]|nr:DUF4279 domain-containing protein [Alphaproteobacteria bacterium]
MKKDPIRSCSLEIGSRNLDPDNVSKLIGVEPDRRFSRGELSCKGKKRIKGLWAVDSDRHVSSLDICDHLAYIVQFLELHKSKILDAKRNACASVSIRVFWDFESTLSFSLDSKILGMHPEVIDGFDISIT